MLVTQVKDLVNEALKEVLGEESLVTENLENVVEVGHSLDTVETTDPNIYDNYVRKLVNQIGRMIFVDYQYEGELPSLRKDGWTYGSVLMKIRTIIPKAEETEDWQLHDKTSYDPNIFYQPQVAAKFFNKRVTFTVPISITRNQVRESFQNAGQLNAFVSMLFTAVNNSLTIANENLSKRCLNNFIAETIYNEYPAPGSTTPYNASSGVRAVNLLYLYNQRYSETLSAADVLEDPDFIRFATFTIKRYAKRLKSASTIFNIGGTEKFTPSSRLHINLLSDFVDAAETFLYSDTFHKELASLPSAETVNFWQGTGTDFGFDSISKIDVKNSEGHSVELAHIIGCMFDENAAMVNNVDKRVTTGYNPVADFYNYWHKQDAQYLNDFDENFIVFFCA